MYTGDAVAGEKQSTEARRKREVRKGRDIIVCEVDRVLILNISTNQHLDLEKSERIQKNRIGAIIVPLQRPNSQSLGSCGLQSAIMISMELILKV